MSNIVVLRSQISIVFDLKYRLSFDVKYRLLSGSKGTEIFRYMQEIKRKIIGKNLQISHQYLDFS